MMEMLEAIEYERYLDRLKYVRHMYGRTGVEIRIENPAISETDDNWKNKSTGEFYLLKNESGWNFFVAEQAAVVAPRDIFVMRHEKIDDFMRENCSVISKFMVSRKTARLFLEKLKKDGAA